MTSRPTALNDRDERWLVIGAGSAGCVVAARLSEDAHRSVTLVDAGPDLSRTDLTAASSGASFMDALEQPGRTFPTLTAIRTSGSVARNYARGRGIGGSSAVNAMVGLRGDPAIYAGWGWDDAVTAWRRVQLPVETPADEELGPIDRALLASHDDAEVAPLTRRSGRRVTSAEAYLWPVDDRPNLVVMPNIAIDTIAVEAGTAVGAVSTDGTHLGADRVVLCAGALHSPWLLQRSGLADVGVGIGEGLQDHPSAPLALQLRAGVDQDAHGLAIGTLLQHRTTTGDLVQLLPMNHLGASVETSGLGLLMIALMTPRSAAGTVRAVPGAAEPLVDFALLDDPHDLAPLVEGCRLARDVLHSPAFDQIVEAVYVDAFGTKLDALTDDAAIVRWLRTHCGDYVHASSSCRIGVALDRNGWLHGVRGLAVCDASAFPSIPDVNTHLPTTMLAELLVQRWRTS